MELLVRTVFRYPMRKALLDGLRRGLGCGARTFLLIGLLISGSACDDEPGQHLTAKSYLSPCAMSVADGGERLYVGCATGNQILVLDLASGNVASVIGIDAGLTGMTLSADGKRLFVTCDDQAQGIRIIDTASGTTVQKFGAGLGACAPVLAQSDRILHVCYRYANRIDVIDLASQKEKAQVEMIRQPIAAALAPNEKLLVIANHLPAGPANGKHVAAKVSIIETISNSVVANVQLPNGSTSLRGIAVCPAGKWCAVSHNFARFKVATTQVEHGWMNDSALSLIDLDNMSLAATVLLDEPLRGAANPWALAWTKDGRTLCVTHSGTHELSLIDVSGLVEKLASLPDGVVVEDLTFLQGIRKRIALKGNGPRTLAIVKEKVYVAEFFSDSISIVDLKTRAPVDSIRLGLNHSEDRKRQGERLFHDARLGHQSWQSCATCHPDGRADGLNWDLLNDGIGNPKNTKSLVFSHRTPPAMSSGIRQTAEQAVRSGLRKILFALRPESEAIAIDEYLKSIRPVQSPYLINGQLSPAAQRGKRIFEDNQSGCAGCHPALLFTDMKAHAVGTSSGKDQPGERFDTPSLVESWRTAPYLHDGSAATIHDVLTARNPADEHGNTSSLTKRQIDDLVAYLLSL